MRLWCVWVTGILLTIAPALRLAAQTPSTSSSPASSSSSGAGTTLPPSSTATPAQPSTEATQPDGTPGAELPVSLDRIREQLARPAVEPLKGLNDAHFRIVIEERQKFDNLIASLKFDSGPPIPGGRAAYEEQQRLFPSVDNPFAQPYSAFTQGELVQVLVTSMMQRLFAGRILNSITTAERENAEARARAEASRAIADYCAAQPGGGAGITMCDAR
jgi:hypothetical protein